MSGPAKVAAYGSPDFGATSKPFVISDDNTAAVYPFDLWALAPSGFRLVVHGWLGDRVLGKPCLVLGGIAVRG